MATILSCTCGWKLLYAANHRLGLPSVDNICTKSQITHLFPITCGLCVCSNNSEILGAVWLYNMEAHLKAFHPGNNQPLHLSTTFITLCTTKQSNISHWNFQRTNPTINFLIIPDILSQFIGFWSCFNFTPLSTKMPSPWTYSVTTKD